MYFLYHDYTKKYDQKKYMHDQDLNAIKSKYSFSNVLEQFVFKLTSKYHTGIKLKYNVLDI